MDKSPSPKTAQIPYWKFKTLCVTKSLKGKLPKYSPDVQEKLSFVQSVVIAHSRKKPQMFTNIGAKAFHNKCRDYRAFIDILKSEGELQVNEKYSTKGHFTKSYRIPPDKLQGLTKIDFRKKRVCAEKDKTEIHGKSVDWQRECFQELTVKDSFISTGDTVQDVIAKRGLSKVKSGAFNASRGRKANRLFNTILEIPSAARSNIIHKQGHTLCEFDWKNCHPFLLLDFCEASEKVWYACFITNPEMDMYSFIPAKAGITMDRTRAKVEFLRFINGGRSKGNCFSDYYLKNFPKLHGAIIRGGKANAAKLQNFESALMEKLGEYCADNKLFFQQQHDGWLGRKDQGGEISGKLIELVYARLGYAPTIKSKELNTTNTTNNKTPPQMSSYVVIKETPPVINGNSETLSTTSFEPSMPVLVVKSPFLPKNALASHRRRKETPVNLFAETLNVKRGDTL